MNHYIIVLVLEIGVGQRTGVPWEVKDTFLGENALKGFGYFEDF
jgi:hypothetical protein